MRPVRLILACLTIWFFACKAPLDQAIKGSLREIPSPADSLSLTPHLFADASGKVYMSWLERHGDTTLLQFASLENDGWSSPALVAKGANWFVNWADYPAMVVDSAGHMLAHFLQKSDTGKFTYDVYITASTDGGNKWTTPHKLHGDTTETEHGFVSMIPCLGGFMVAWLDGRNTAGAGHDGHHETVAGTDTTRAMTLRAALLDTLGNKKQEWLLDNRVCDCCQTSLAAGPWGIAAVYRDRSAKEVRDMSVVLFQNGQWQAPRNLYRDQWVTNACPVNGPRLDALGNSLAVAWFSAPEKAARVQVMMSKNGSAAFEEPVPIDLGKPLGRVDLCWLNETSLVVCWLESDSIRLRQVNTNGSKTASVAVAAMSESRKSGFPQMVYAAGKLIFAWTDDRVNRVKTGILTL